jgi:hypothetical protein
MKFPLILRNKFVKWIIDSVTFMTSIELPIMAATSISQLPGALAQPNWPLLLSTEHSIEYLECECIFNNIKLVLWKTALSPDGNVEANQLVLWGEHGDSRGLRRQI